MQGHRLAGGDYEPIPPNDDGFLDSRELELRLRIAEGHLQFVRRDTGERLLTRVERVQREAEARQREAQARLAAEAEVARLRTELARRRPSAE